MLEFCFDTVQQETGHWSCLFVALHQLPVVLQIHEPKQRATRRSVVRLPFLMTRSLSREYLKPPIDFRGNHRQCAQEKALQLVIDGAKSCRRRITSQTLHVKNQGRAVRERFHTTQFRSIESIDWAQNSNTASPTSKAVPCASFGTFKR